MKNKFTNIDQNNVNKNNLTNSKSQANQNTNFSKNNKKFELSPIKSESSIPSEKLFEESEKSSNENSSIAVKKFKIKARNFSFSKNSYSEDQNNELNSENTNVKDIIKTNEAGANKNSSKKNYMYYDDYNNQDYNYNLINDSNIAEINNMESINTRKEIHFKEENDDDEEKNVLKTANPKNSRIARNQNLRNIVGYTPFMQEKKEITFFSNTSKLLRKSIPLMICMLVQMLEMNITLIIFSNHYNDIRLISALGLVNLYLTFMITPFIIPLEETFFMLGSTALAANKIKTFMNIYMKTQFFSVLMSVFFVFINIFLFKPLMFFLNFEESLINDCYMYFLNMIPYIILESTLFVNFSFMNVLKSYKYIYFINIVKLMSVFVSCFIFILYLDLSIFGIAYSFSVSYAIAVFFCLFFLGSIKQELKEHKKLEISFEFNTKIFQGLKSFIKFVSMNIFLMLAESWADEILNFFASKLTYDEFSVYSMVFEHLSLFFSLEMGIGISASLIISKFLGRLKDSSNSSITDMKRIINYTLSFIACFFFLMYLCVYLLSDYNSQFYFSEVKYQLLFAENLKYFSFVSYFQGMFLLLQEIMVNLKNQQYALFNSILIGYGIKISLAYVLIFWYNKGLYGLYIAVFVSSIIGISLALYTVLNTDYEQLQKLISEEMESEEDKVEEEIMNQLGEE